MLNKKSYFAASMVAALVAVSSLPAYADHHMATDGMMFKEDIYKEYEQREPCQNYKKLPDSLMHWDRCSNDNVPDMNVQKSLMPVVATYVVYFDFDKAVVRPDQIGVIDRLARELKTYDPAQVTIVGHADTAGSAAYNQMLSAKRAMAVSDVLTARNIQSTMLDERAVGEQDLAVPTPDGTKLEANRRVVIQFRR